MTKHTTNRRAFAPRLFPIRITPFLHGVKREWLTACLQQTTAGSFPAFFIIRAVSIYVNVFHASPGISRSFSPVLARKISSQYQTSTTRFLTCAKDRATPGLTRSLVLSPTSTPKPRAEGRWPPVALCRAGLGCPCHKTGENTGFSPVFFLHVLYGNGVHFGSDTWFSHPFAPVPNRCHPLKHPKRTRLQLFSPEIGCVSLFLPSFDLQKFRAGFSQTSGLSSHSYRFILTRPFPNAMIRIPSFVSNFFLTGSDIIVTYVHNAPQVKASCKGEKNFENLQRPAQPCGKIP